MPFLNGKTADFITEIAPLLTEINCDIGDYIVRRGELANEIFFLYEAGLAKTRAEYGPIKYVFYLFFNAIYQNKQ